MPAIILGNIDLFFSGHISLAVTVNIEASIAWQTILETQYRQARHYGILWSWRISSWRESRPRRGPGIQTHDWKGSGPHNQPSHRTGAD
jgi:hypothetical protein